MSAALRVRRSIQDLQDEFDKGNKKPLEDVMRAWKGIKALPPDDPRSFFVLGGYHGEPFRGAGWGNSQYWGGYCNHGNILFPTWHRVYLLKLEDALRSIPGCADVALPFWDETSDASVNRGIPSALTQKDFVLDGQTIPNPLRSFVFPHGIVDHLSPIPDADYSKPEGYETVRYPLSGLVGTDEDKAATAAHNAKFPNFDTNVELLNDNIRNWLSATVIVDGKPVGGGHVKDRYMACLNAPNYTVFSNTTSAAQWFDDKGQRVVPVESPHNSIHLAVGGFDLPKIFDASPIDGANGDMGENDTAGLDPIFFFHHCFVDRVFWLWQKKNGFTDRLEIIPQYPGTNSVDSQGPTPGTAANSWLTLESPLDPFKLTDGSKQRAYTSQDCINIEKQLGYTYGPGSLDQPASLAAVSSASDARTISVRGLNRARIRGSFLISAFANVDGKRQHIGTEAVLSRWHVDGCANCQTHIEGRAAISMHALGEAASKITAAEIEVQVRTRDGTLGSGSQQRAMAALSAAPGKKLFKVELR